jgi:hypothetical protein
MERVQRLSLSKLEFAPLTHKLAVNKIKKEHLKAILRHVYKTYPDWWNWKDNHTVEDEVDTVFNNIRKNEKDKGTQTTIASIGQVLLDNVPHSKKNTRIMGVNYIKL